MSRKSLTGFDSNNQRIVNVGDPTNLTDGTNKQYVDNRVDGLSYKDEVRAASTASGTLASAYAAGQSLDGITLATGDRILLKDQATASENGIYTVNASGAPTRSGDANTSAELNNATVYVNDGTVNGGREYTQTARNPTLGTTSITFVQKQAGVSYTADGNGIELSGTTFSIELDGTSLTKTAAGIKLGSGSGGAGLTTDANGAVNVGQGTGITVTADAIAVDFGVVVRKYAADCVASTNPQTFTHGLGTLDVDVTLREVATGVLVDADVTATSTTAISVNFGSAPAAGAYRVVVMG